MLMKAIVVVGGFGKVFAICASEGRAQLVKYATLRCVTKTSALLFFNNSVRNQPILIIFGRSFVKRFALCCRTVVCLSCLSVYLKRCCIVGKRLDALRYHLVW